MRATTPLLLIGAALLWSLPMASVRAQGPTPSTFDHVSLARHALERHILPGYARLAEATNTLDTALATHCRATTPQSRKSVEEAFDRFVTSWGRIEHIAFGPITRHERLERIMFWPDRRGIGARQVASALSKRDPDVVDAGRLTSKSVAMQGLPALDALLFGDDQPADPDARRHRCAFAAAIAANLAGITKEVSDEWTAPGGFAALWLTPGPANGQFLKPSETTLALAKSFDKGLETVRDQRLAGPLGLTAQRRKIPAPLTRSGRSLQLVVANLEGLRELYDEGGIERALIDAGRDDASSGIEALAHLVSNELETAQSSLVAVVGIRSPFDDAKATQRIIAIGFPLKNARTTASSLLSSAAGLPTGFNASDGD